MKSRYKTCYVAYFDILGFKNFVLESEKDECLLPNGANKIVELNRGKIRVFTSTEQWFGMTYPEDRALVKSELATKIQQGYYPEQLWQK